MKFTPQILGAVAVVAIAGAVSGATIGESPVLKRGHTDTMPQAQIVTAGNAALNSSKRPPDHYPLETPQGTIEVGELALHGRLRDRGGDMWWERRGEDRAELSAGYDFYGTASPERIAHEERLLAFTGDRAEYQDRNQRHAPPPSQARRTRAEAPMALAEPVEVAVVDDAPVEEVQAEPSIGNSKTVDVTAALARRD